MRKRSAAPGSPCWASIAEENPGDLHDTSPVESMWGGNAHYRTGIDIPRARKPSCDGASDWICGDSPRLGVDGTADSGLVERGQHLQRREIPDPAGQR